MFFNWNLIGIWLHYICILHIMEFKTPSSLLNPETKKLLNNSGLPLNEVIATLIRVLPNFCNEYFLIKCCACPAQPCSLVSENPAVDGVLWRGARTWSGTCSYSWAVDNNVSDMTSCRGEAKECLAGLLACLLITWWNSPWILHLLVLPWQHWFDSVCEGHIRKYKI